MSLRSFLEEDHAGTLEKVNEFQNLLVNLQYEGKAWRGSNLKQIGGLLRFFKKEVGRHMRIEEEVEFPFLKTHLPRLECLIEFLSAEHREFRRNLRALEFLWAQLARNSRASSHPKWMERFTGRAGYVANFLKGHLQEESKILYRVADRLLRSEEKRALVKKIRRWGKGAGWEVLPGEK